MPDFADIQRAVRRIPRGKVATYGEVARGAGYSRGARQVARALSVNDVQDLPWHRVLGSGGHIRLRGEAGLLQRTLLRLEGVPFRGARVDMEQCGFRFPSSPSRGQGSRTNPQKTQSRPRSRGAGTTEKQ